MTKYLLFICPVLIVVSCSKNTLIVDEDEMLISDPISKLLINSEIDQQLQTGDIFYWDKVSAEIVWSAAVHSDSIISIGYNLDGYDIVTGIHEVEVSKGRWAEKKNEIIDIL